ncbi:MAG TPA: hypothetical protein VL866_19860 [Pyrinomonadaceae bacterium]|nr:hypothetical protein [Pyrinomonadaceae bacterium]
MNVRHLCRKFAGAILGFTLLLAIGVGSNINALAQDRTRSTDENHRDRNWDRFGNYGGSFELRQTALNAGYNEGIRESLKDRDRNRSIDYRTLSTYQNATKDYSSRLGNRELYRRYFREAFATGYNGDIYRQGNNDRDDRYRDRKQNRRGRNDDGYSNLGGSPQLRQTALNAGFNEGLKQGRNDRNKRNGNGYQNQNTYQKATKDYSSSLGDREVYRRYFREAYEHGYDDGVSGN